MSQDATLGKLEVLRSILENEGYTVTSPKRSRKQTVEKSIAVPTPPSFSRRYNSINSIEKPSIESIPVTERGQNSFLLNNGIDSQISLPSVINIGGPLESVLEAEYETDGMPTPCSNLESPETPAISTTQEKRKKDRISSSFRLRSPFTPPTLSNSFTNSADTLLKNTKDVGENMEDKSPKLSNVYSRDHKLLSKDVSRKHIAQEQDNFQQQHLYEFLDEDDMITLDTQSTMTKNNTFYSPAMTGGTSNEQQTSTEEGWQFLARMEGMLERVEETILEDSQSSRNDEKIRDASTCSDEYQGASVPITQGDEDDKPLAWTSSNSRLGTLSHRQSRNNIYQVESTTNGSDNNSITDESKDSTNVVATQVAEEDTLKDELESFLLNEYDIKSQNSAKSFLERPSHILVNTELASPANTNITMDATFINETNEKSFLQGESKKYRNNREKIARENICHRDIEDEDNLSTVTPVLDRYRLDPSDDNSIGVKVVPNNRSAHRSKKEHIVTPRQGRLPTISQLSPSLDYILKSITPQKESNHLDFLSPPKPTQGLLEKASTKFTPNPNRKVYRKTPFPKRKPSLSKDDGIGRKSMDENYDPNISDGSSFSISIPPLRPRSFDPKATEVLYSAANEELQLCE